MSESPKRLGSVSYLGNSEDFRQNGPVDPQSKEPAESLFA